MTRWGMSRAGTREALGSRLILMAKFLPMAVPGRPGGSVMTIDRPVRPLLTVKQLIPPVRPGAVRRARLERRLRDADTGLTIVVAPAGWGKTSLLSSWASNPGERVRVAWVSLDESDDEPTRFWSYVLTALRGASDEISPAALDALAVPGADPMDLALPILLNELATSSIPHVLVLDDFHVLGRPADPRERRVPRHLSAGVVAAGGGRPRRSAAADRPDARPRGADRAARRGSSVVARRGGRAGVGRVGIRPGRCARPPRSGTGPRAGRPVCSWPAWPAGAAAAPAADPSARRRSAPARLLHRGGVARHHARATRPAGAGRTVGTTVGFAVRRRTAGHRFRGGAGGAGPGRPVPGRPRRRARVVSMPPPVPRRVAARTRGPIGSRAPARSCAAPRRGSNSTTRSTRRSGTCCGPTTRRQQRHCWSRRSRGSSSAAPPPTYLMLGEQLPHAQVRPQLAIVLAYAAATSGRLDRVPHWLDICDEQIAPDTVVRGWRQPPGGRADDARRHRHSGHRIRPGGRAVPSRRSTLETDAGGTGGRSR